MENYIVINGKAAELTPKQLKQLGIVVPPPKVLGDYTMDDVLEIIRSGKAPEKLKLHSIIKFAGYGLEIIGTNHDRPETTFRGGTPTITVMATRLIARRPMHSGKCEGGWKDTELREWLNWEFYDSLPKELKEIITPAHRTSNKGYDCEAATDDRLFLPTESELFGSAIYSGCMTGGMKIGTIWGEKYGAFKTSKDRIRRYKEGTFWGETYWTSSIVSCSSTEFAVVTGNGHIDCAPASKICGVPLCFQIC